MKVNKVQLSVLLGVLVSQLNPALAFEPGFVQGLRDELKDICGYKPEETVPRNLEIEIDKTLKCVSDLPKFTPPKTYFKDPFATSLSADVVPCSESSVFRFSIERIPSRLGLVIGILGTNYQTDNHKFDSLCGDSILGKGKLKIASKAIWIEPRPEFEVKRVAKIEILEGLEGQEGQEGNEEIDPKLWESERKAMSLITGSTKTAGMGLVQNVLSYHVKSGSEERSPKEYLLQERYSSNLVNAMPSDVDTLIHQAIQTLQGLQYIHDQGFVHRDIKPSNIFIGNDGSAFIGGFGFAIEVGNLGKGMSGTPSYLAPEVVKTYLGGHFPFRKKNWKLFRKSNVIKADRVDTYALGISLASVATIHTRGLERHNLAESILDILDENEHVFSFVWQSVEEGKKYFNTIYKNRIMSFYEVIEEDIDKIPSLPEESGKQKKYFQILALLFHPNPSKRMEIRSAIPKLCRLVPGFCASK